MSQQVRIFIINLVVLFLIIAFFGGFFYFLARTAQGSWLLTKLVITAYVGTRQVTFQSVTGSLLTQLTYKNVEIKEIPPKSDVTEGVHCNLKRQLLLHQIDTSFHEISKSLSLEHVVSQQSKVYKLVGQLIPNTKLFEFFPA